MPESSPETADEAATPVEASQADTADVKVSAESSPAGSEGAKDLLSSVRDALKSSETSPPSKTEESSAAEGAATAIDKTVAAETDADDLTEEELARLKPKTRKRIENLTAARRERDGQIAELEPKAKQFDQMLRFIGDSNLSLDEVNEGFEVMRLLKHDPLKAWDRLKPIVDQLLPMIGAVLPEELQRAVNEGQITEAHARELALSRSKAAVSDAQLRQRDSQDEQRRHAAAFQESQGRVHSSIAEWEKSKAGSDPDWKLKQPRVMEKVQLETLRRQRQDPNFVWSPDEALKFAEEGVKQVNEEFRRFAPKPKPLNPITDAASTRSEARPASLLEAARLGLARMAG